MVGLTSTPAMAAGPPKQVRFDCTTSNGGFAWYVPNGVTSFQLEVAGGAGGSQPGYTGRGGKGAVVTATVDVWQDGLTAFISVGCSGARPAQGNTDGGQGGLGLTANNGARGGSSTTVGVIQGGNGPGDALLVRSGGGGGGGGRGSGFGVNAGGDGGDAGANGMPGGSPATPGDNGRPGGGASGTANSQGAPSPRCPAVGSLNVGHPGFQAKDIGGGGGGGGGGDAGGCGGGAGSRVVSAGGTTIGSGGGGQAGSTAYFGDHLAGVSFAGTNRGDGYVLITYQGG
jgi:hypothetical protein